MRVIPRGTARDAEGPGAAALPRVPSRPTKPESPSEGPVLRSIARWVLLSSALSQAGCLAFVKQETGAIGPDDLVGTTWMTITVDGAPAPVDVESTLTFASGTELAGNGGCNPFSASLQMQVNEMVVGPIHRGGRTCRPEVMSTESAFLDALAKVASYRGTDLFLYLSDGTGRQRMSLGRMQPGSPPNRGAP